MQPQLTSTIATQEIRSTVTSKRQVTIPSLVRKALAVKLGDHVVFRLDKRFASKEVALSLRPGLSLEETFAFIQSLHQPEDYQKLRELAIEDKVERELQKLNQEA